MKKGFAKELPTMKSVFSEIKQEQQAKLEANRAFYMEMAQTVIGE